MPEIMAPAKINLFLLVGPRREDGYHPVCSLMEKVSIYDRVRVKPAGQPGLSLSGKGLPPGENTIEKAARLLEREAGSPLAVDVELLKEIPMAAGLAGGSSDAAAALVLLVAESGIKISRERLMEVAAEVGADVPFFLADGPQLAQGMGERLTPVRFVPDYVAVVVTPDAGLSTADIYGRFDLTGPSADPEGFAGRCRQTWEALEKAGSLESLGDLLHNDLEPAAIPMCPEIGKIKSALLKLGAAGSLMSGSGPSVFGLFAGKKEAVDAAAALRRTYGRVWVASPLR